MKREFIRGITYDLIPGITYDLVKPFEYGPVWGITYDEEPEYVEEPEVITMNQTSVVPAVEEPKQVEIRTCYQGEIVKAEPSEKLNFTLKLVRRIIEIEDSATGEIKRCFYHVKIMVRSLSGEIIPYEYTIASEKIKSYEWLKRATNSVASIPQDKEEKTEFFRKVQMCIEEQGVPTEVVYPTPGWRKIDRYGWRFVHATGMIGEGTSFIHTNSPEHFLDIKQDMLGTLECFRYAMAMTEVCTNMAASTELFLFSHTALLTSIFKEAGYPIFLFLV